MPQSYFKVVSAYQASAAVICRARDLPLVCCSSLAIMKRGFAGGSRQVSDRVKRAALEPPAERTGGQLAHLLLAKRAWGEMQSTTVQQIAAAAVADGASCPRLLQLSRIGNSGLCLGNCERDLDSTASPAVSSFNLR
jgi:hypothetical protein